MAKVFTPEEQTAYNAMVAQWTGMVGRKISGSAAQFVHGKKGMVQRGQRTHHLRSELKLYKSIKGHTGSSEKDGTLDYIGFDLERHGVFVQKGVGRGHAADGGMVIRGRKMKKFEEEYAKKKNRATSRTNRAVPVIKYGGNTTRKPVDWFNRVLDERLPQLAEKVAEMNADAVLNKARIYIR